MQLVLFNPYLWPLSGAATPGQSGSGNNGNEGVLCIPQSSSITGTSPSDYLVSCPGHSFGWGSYPSAEVQSVYSTAPADWAIYVTNHHVRLHYIWQIWFNQSQLMIYNMKLSHELVIIIFYLSLNYLIFSEHLYSFHHFRFYHTVL